MCRRKLDGITGEVTQNDLYKIGIGLKIDIIHRLFFQGDVFTGSKLFI